ncbi:MAG: hypothetical protein P1V51_05880 [Deltaproteobacteria bacterium]|nr:hypothetical protein [Deltaproteobacteria bacterium]
MRRRILGLASALALLALPACGGEEGGGATFAVDRQALLDRGLLSLVVEPYAGEDLSGGLVDCDRLVRAYDATTDFSPIGASQVIELSGENSVTVEIPDLQPGIAFFLVVGYDGAGGIGTITQAGCGEAVIRRGEKSAVTVALRDVP